GGREPCPGGAERARRPPAGRGHRRSRGRRRHRGVPRRPQEARHPLPRRGDHPPLHAGLERTTASPGPRLRPADPAILPPREPLPHLLMARFLHLLNRDSPAIAGAVVEQNRREAGVQVTVVLLDDDTQAPAQVTVKRLGADVDYAGLLELIFASDHVVSW